MSQTDSSPTCPLCDCKRATIGRVANRDAYECDCPVCGQYIFTEEAVHALGTDANEPRRYLLSAVTRRASDAGDPIELLSYAVADLLDKTLPPKTPYDVLDPLLLAIHRSTTDVTAYVRVPYDEHPLFCLRSIKQLGEFLNLLQSLNFIEVVDKPDEACFVCRLTLHGWDRVAELRKTGQASDRAFVAMSFAEELDAVWTQAMEPALTDAGWLPVRMDRMEHNDRIDDRIIAEIKGAGLVVADFTGNRSGVYFEAGLALGLGLPVIWTVRDTELDMVHLDTRQYNHIDWKDTADLRQRLYHRLLATVGPPSA